MTISSHREVGMKEGGIQYKNSNKNLQKCIGSMGGGGQTNPYSNSKNNLDKCITIKTIDQLNLP